MDRQTVRDQLANHLPDQLIDELLEAHEEAKTNFYLGGLRLAEVEGGRFCEAAFRILEYATTGTYTPLGQSLNTEQLIRALAQLPAADYSDSIRLHIPRSLRVVYDIRNKRDAAHLADGIDPNFQDSSLVCATIDWVLAEFIRLYHRVSPNEASEIVDSIIERKAPLIQEFDGFLKVLNPNLGASDCCLVLLYQCGKSGATIAQIERWIRPTMRRNLRRTLTRLRDDKAFVHESNPGMFFITRSGEQHVESQHLLSPE